MRKRAQVAAGLQLAARQERREAQTHRAPGHRLAGQQRLQGEAHVLELGTVAVQAGNTGGDQQAVLEQLVEERLLVR